jgi:hypothetical protein
MLVGSDLNASGYRLELETMTEVLGLDMSISQERWGCARDWEVTIGDHGLSLSQ